LKNKTRNWRQKLYVVIYGTTTKEGKVFDIVLLWVIIASIVLVMLESVKTLDSKYHTFFNIAEWVITILFTFEYIARIVTVKKTSNYIFSFFGIIDLLSTIPKYLSLIFGGTHALVALRALRLMRVFRILKLVRYVGESNRLLKALKASRIKILVFLFAVIVLCIILGTIMYLIEGELGEFTSIPRGVYWAIVTLTTVGYGDIAPHTGLGQFVASIVMLLGYSIIAIPTGIISAEMTKQTIHRRSRTCTSCSSDRNIDGAKYCSDCGAKL
jgi:voltage-gated potassium channel